MKERLSLRGVTAGYGDDGPPQPDRVDLSLSAGELVCVLGPNGAGNARPGGLGPARAA